MEDAVDDFMVRVAGGDPDAASAFKQIAGKVTGMVKRARDRHQIAGKIQHVKKLSKELAELRARYTVRGPGANLAASVGIDPRVLGLYKKESDLVGIEEARDKVIRMLTETAAGPHDRASDQIQSLKIVPIVGVGGLGKTTLAKTVCDTLKKDFDCSALFSVGRNPHMTRVFEKLLVELDEKYSHIDMSRWDEERFCNELHKFLSNKRYFIVVDDIWDKESWRIIRDFLKDNDCGGSKIIMTTRNSEVISKAEEVYILKPLSNGNSKKLFYKRVQSQEAESLDNTAVEVSSKIIDKCGGIPLAIIAAASLLADKSCQDWEKVYDSIGFGKKEDSTMRILSYSYYDLPSYLKPCLLYVSIFPEDSIFYIYDLIWMWIAEGFVHIEEDGQRLFEIGERYFNELVNRSMIQLADGGRYCNVIKRCFVHDIVLDLIRKLSIGENFVTILSKEHYISPNSSRGEMKVCIPCSDSKARRLTIQHCDVQDIPQDIMNSAEMLRSICLIFSGLDNMPPLRTSFRACRVLFIHHSYIPMNGIKHLRKLWHLKCLVKQGKLFSEVSKEIGQLKSLQALVLYYADENCLVVEKMLPGICSLPQLLCLKLIVGRLKRLPAGGISNLVYLEQLELCSIADQSTAEAFVVELGKLTRLRVLNIIFSEVKLEESLQKALVQSLCSLQRLQELVLDVIHQNVHFLYPGTNVWELWEPPRELRQLRIQGIEFSRCPAWMDSSRLPCLNFLFVSFCVVVVQDLNNIANFPMLHDFHLRGASWPPMYTVGTNGFKNLRNCSMGTILKFSMDAMPRLEVLSLRVFAACLDYAISDGSLVEQFPKSDAIGDLDFGLDKLRSLEQVNIKVNCSKATLAQVQGMEAAVRRAVEGHPNRPTLRMIRVFQSNMLSDQQYHEQVQSPDAEFVVSVRNINDNEADVGFILVLQSSMCLYLQTAIFFIDYAGASMTQVEKVEAALRHAANLRHNHPTLQLVRINTEEMASSADHPNTEVNDHGDPIRNLFSKVKLISRNSPRPILSAQQTMQDV